MPVKVILPVTLMVPVETETIEFLPVVALPAILIDAAFNVPAPTASILDTEAVGEFIVIAPETFKVIPLFIVIPLAAAAALIVMLATAAVVTSTVTVIPELIKIISPETGTAAPPHVAVALQLPVTVAVLVAACAWCILPKKQINKINKDIFFKVSNCIILIL